MLPRLFEDAGMRQTADGGIVILQGRNVGGSTVHNLCYAFRTPDPIVTMWRNEHQLAELSAEALAHLRSSGSRRICTSNPSARTRSTRSTACCEAGTEKLGYSGFVTRHNREGCVQSGYCMLGCSYGAKQSMLVTYVPRAHRAGARIYAQVRAERIEAEGGRVRRVLGSVLDSDGRVTGSVEVKTPVVVLAAGAVNSPDLLQRSGLAGGSGQLGRNLHLHPSVMVAGFWDEPIHAYRGIPQSYYIDEFIDLERDPHRGYVLMPIAGFPVLTAVNLPGFGASHFQQMRDFSKMGGLLVLLHDRSGGSVESGDVPGRPTIEYALDAEDRAQLAQVEFGTARRCCSPRGRAGCWCRTRPSPGCSAPATIFAACATRSTWARPPSPRPIPNRRAAWAATRPASVVNAWGESHDVAGLFVADMSVFPTSLGAPPQITTAALADRTAQHILARWDELSA